MRVPERPQRLSDIDLMMRLKAYSEGKATWFPSGQELGFHEQTACQELHVHLTALIERCLHPLMDRVTSREMQGFTMHDRGHGLKVTHLMWHIMEPSRRELLSPGEIALLVVAAHLHDLGMGLSQEERAARLHPESDLWDKIDSQSSYSKALTSLTDLAKKDDLSEPIKTEALYQVQQAQEALLCMDGRERHATRERYDEIINSLEDMHKIDPTNIPNISTLLSFDGNSYKDKLIDICVSHNQDAQVLLDRDATNVDQWRFPTQYPIGCCLADTRLVAAALRLADILDFDRERTPAVLFHYLLPRSADPSENVSVREWSKHLSISNWEIERGKVVFRGRSDSAFIHHTIVEFCRNIEDEISRTLSVFGSEEWPFCIQPHVEAAIEASGYRYVPYRFSLDEERVYELLMGKNIYRNRLDALRELVQNAVDACKLRDALLLCHDKSVTPSKEQRIIVRYEDPNVRTKAAVLSVIDTGIGMDRSVIENYFLKVGRSYYKSSDFLRTRSLLRRQNIDFSPLSEFGIGFMAVFMLGDRVEVETASSFPARNDTQRRLLRIDGLGRLIEVTEDENTAIPRFFGTRVSVQLTSLIDQREPPTWNEVETCLRHVCRNLDYPLYLQHVTPSGTTETQILPEGLCVPIPEYLADAALVIPVDDPQNGLDGQIVLFRARESGEAEAALAEKTPVRSADYPHFRSRGSGILLRGGFAIGPVPGLPEFVLTPSPDARIEVSKDRDQPRSLPVTDLARSRVLQSDDIEDAVFRIWLDALLSSLEDIEAKPIGSPEVHGSLIRRARWLEQYDAFQLYRLARTSWQSAFKDSAKAKTAITQWESGQGSGLWVDSCYGRSLHWEIFELILPKVTKLAVGPQANYYVLPPRQNWESDLRSWNSFVKDDLVWGDFAQYSETIEDVLCDVYAGARFLNIKYQDRFSDFSHEDIGRLIRIFDSLAHAKSYGRQASVSSSDLPLLDRALSVAGDLTISWLQSRHTLARLAAGRD